MFLERGLVFSHKTVRTWEMLVAPLLMEHLRAGRRGKADVRRYVDEARVKIQEVWCYLYRAIDAAGNVMLSVHRDLEAATRFLTRALAVVRHTPVEVTTDGHDAYPGVIRETLGESVVHRCSRHRNNHIPVTPRSPLHADICGGLRGPTPFSAASADG
jgi:transposase-like protein